MGESNLTVTKSNHLIEASYKLTLNEQRLILACIAQLDSRKPMPNSKLTVRAIDFAETYGVPEHKAYEYLEEATTKLFERDIKTYDGRSRTRFRWVDWVKYHDGEGYVSLSFTRWVAPYLTLLHKQFTSYRLVQIASLRSVYAIRLYELLMQFKETGKREISLQKFKDRLELSDKYNRFSNLKARVIESAVKELEVKSNLLIEWEPIRKGRTVIALSFVFQEDLQGRLPL